MRADYDAAAKWTPFPAWGEAELVRDGWQARALVGLHQTLLSGDLAAAQATLPLPAHEVGLWAVAAASPVLARIARDRALLVSPEPIPIASGWHEAGWAASAADGAFIAFELSGPALGALVREGVSADLESPSPSAACLFAGVWGLLYRTGPATARLHVETALAPFVWRWLELGR